MDHNPKTPEEARAFVKHVESLFMPWNVAGLCAGFTEDCVVRFGDLPEIRGRAALEKLFTSRSKRQVGYRLRKTFHALMGDKIANSWEGEWQDSQTGRPMKGFGVEVWQMRDGKVALWEAAFNASEPDKATSIAVT